MLDSQEKSQIRLIGNAVQVMIAHITSNRVRHLEPLVSTPSGAEFADSSVTPFMTEPEDIRAFAG